MLTNAENRILELMADGFSNDEIATILFVSPNTVKSHITHIYHKLSLFADNRKDFSILRVRAVLWYLTQKENKNE